MRRPIHNNKPGMFPTWAAAIRALSFWVALLAASWAIVIGFAWGVAWLLKIAIGT